MNELQVFRSFVIKRVWISNRQQGPLSFNTAPPVFVIKKPTLFQLLFMNELCQPIKTFGSRLSGEVRKVFTGFRSFIRLGVVSINWADICIHVNFCSICTGKVWVETDETASAVLDFNSFRCRSKDRNWIYKAEIIIYNAVHVIFFCLQLASIVLINMSYEQVYFSQNNNDGLVFYMASLILLEALFSSTSRLQWN